MRLIPQFFRGSKDDDLKYAATARCPCGALLAYRRGDTSWDCSRILRGTADETVTHTDRLPFAFYKVKAAT